MNLYHRNLLSEIIIRASRSSGKGGQHVNKVSTKIDLGLDIVHSNLLTTDEKKIILEKLRNRINENGVLKIIVQSERSQLQNKKIAIEKLYGLLEKSLTPQKKRIASKPGKAAQRKRVAKKKELSEKKKTRIKKIDWE